MIFLVPWTSLKKLVIMVLDLTLIRSIISQKPLKFFALCRNHALCEKKKEILSKFPVHFQHFNLVSGLQISITSW